MKKLVSVLLVALLLCAGLGLVGASAAEPAPAIVNSTWQNMATAALNSLLGSSLGDAAIGAFITTLQTLQNLGFDVSGFLEAVDDVLPMSVKAALHDAGIKSYPIWERDMLFYLIFRYLLFGWYWM